jgi:hypothetical protein
VAVAGRKPIEDRSQARNRMPAAEGTEWREVYNVPYQDGPPLPARAGGWTKEDPNSEESTPAERGWPDWTERWYGVVSRMPHAVLWDPSDWEFVFAVAEAHARFIEGWKGCATGAELRIKEKAIGMTHDARRDLRIRYVDPPDPDADLPANVTRVDFGTL